MAEEASTCLEGRMSIDMAAEELRRSLAELGRITGRVDLDEILDVVFSDFCIGK
jgi:tRNA modification GTPase